MSTKIAVGIFCAAVIFSLATVDAADSPIGVSTEIEPAGYFVPKWPYNASTINYPFESELNNSYACKLGTNIPGANMYQAVLTLAPCTYITEHYHPEASEFNHILRGGALKWHIVLGNGSLIHGQTELGSSQVMPQGLTHVILNDNCDSTSFFHYFPIINPIFMFSVPAVVNMPTAFKDNTFGASVASQMNLKNIPDGIHTLDDACLARCNMKKADFEAGGSRSAGLCTTLNAQGF